ncbi:MAG: hypothetical protein Q9174_003279 [Haloplaca sp. 1 TL-2023]
MAEPLNGWQFQDTDHDGQLKKHNTAISILVEIFPHVLPEVFREMLRRFDGDSQLELVLDQLLRFEDRWVKGRLRPQLENIDATTIIDISTIPVTDFFRRTRYQWAVKTALVQEFGSLSKSTIKAVMAEQNYSYSLVRPILQDIASKSWRHSINKFFSRWSRRREDQSEKHALIRWVKAADGTHVPTLKATGDDELDNELYQTVLAPLFARNKEHQEATDWTLAAQLNHDEAEKNDALFECGCCFSETTFESIATCSASAHVICYNCIAHAVSEALFGQGWAQGIDHERGLIRCIVPAKDDGCTGCIPQDAIQRAVHQMKGGTKIYSRLQSRLAEESLAKAKVSLIRCPRCSYAEITDLYIPPGHVRHHLALYRPLRTFVFVLLGLAFLPFLALYMMMASFIFDIGTPSSLSSIFKLSFSRLINASQFPARFQCRSPTCSALTCTTCFKLWRDPHTCFASAAVELRTSIEAARTAALKRTCPKCNLAFIKDSGCNKLACVCGYAMCYVCRQGLVVGEGGEGYRHFCQHFRHRGGRCDECDKCDLYQTQDEDEVVRLAGLEAEKEWRRKQGQILHQGGKVGNEGGGDQAVGENTGGGWTIQGLIDWWVKTCFTCSVSSEGER